MKLRFSIRELILVTIIVALALGWWLDHARLAALEHPTDIEFRHLKAAMQVMEFDHKQLEKAFVRLQEQQEPTAK